MVLHGKTTDDTTRDGKLDAISLSGLGKVERSENIPMAQQMTGDVTGHSTTEKRSNARNRQISTIQRKYVSQTIIQFFRPFLPLCFRPSGGPSLGAEGDVPSCFSSRRARMSVVKRFSTFVAVLAEVSMNSQPKY